MPLPEEFKQKEGNAERYGRVNVIIKNGFLTVAIPVALIPKRPTPVGDIRPNHVTVFYSSTGRFPAKDTIVSCTGTFVIVYSNGEKWPRERKLDSDCNGDSGCCQQKDGLSFEMWILLSNNSRRPNSTIGGIECFESSPLRIQNM